MSPALIEALVVLAAQYGPGFVSSIVAIFKKQNVTVDDIDVLFANVKPYSAYNIPDKVPNPVLTSLANP